MTVLTPTARAAGRRYSFWIGMASIALLVVLVSLLITRAGSVTGDPLSPTNAAPVGAMAVAEVLADQGVTVTPTGSLGETTSAASDADEPTIFIVDADNTLVGSQLDDIAADAGHLVLMSPNFGMLDGFAPEIALAGSVSGVLDADCAVGAVDRAQSVLGDGTGYRLVGDAPDAVECLDSGDDVFSLIQLQRDGYLLTVVGTWDAFSNERVAQEGNAALALNLLGGADDLIWYEPSIEDSLVPGAPTVGELTPVWVSAALVMLLLAFIAAAIWRGRRFGPLVVENLPVTVRASETMEGRARLYQSSSARTHAIDTLRIGTVDRIARLCGLPRLATVEEVIATASSITGTDHGRVRALLLGDVPAGDRELVALSDALLQLERRVAHAVDPTSRTTTTETSPPFSEST